MSCVFWRDIAAFRLAPRCALSRASVLRAKVAVLGRVPPNAVVHHNAHSWVAKC